MTIFSPSNHGLRSRGPTGWQAANADAERRRAEQAARDADPVEQAVRYLRTRGRVIFRASTQDGPHDKWKMNGRLFTGAEVIAQAEQLRGLTERLRPAQAAPIPQAANDPPITFIAPRSLPVPVSTPAARTTADRKKDAEMADITELARCKARGTTPARVQKHLRQLKDVLGTAGCADRLGIGKSTLGNCISGHAAVGDTVLNALYGHSGSDLLPHLAAVLAPAEPSPEPAVVAPAAADVMPPIAGVFTDTPADLQPLLEQYAAHDPAPADAGPADDQPEGEVVPEGKPYDAAAEELGHIAGDPAASAADDQDAIAQQRAGRAELLAAIESAPGIDAPPASDLNQVAPSAPKAFVEVRVIVDPVLAAIKVADLLAAAERRRAALRTELAAIDGQIAAVLQLAGVAA